jgi:hypothetical protein
MGERRAGLPKCGNEGDASVKRTVENVLANTTIPFTTPLLLPHSAQTI